MNEIFPNTPTAAVQLFIIVRKSDQENSIIIPLSKFNFGSRIKILKMGSITFFRECSHWNMDRCNILFRSHWYHSSTSYKPSVLQGLAGVKFIIHLPETIHNGRLYLMSGHFFLNPRYEVGKSYPFSLPKERKSLRSDVNILWGNLLSTFLIFLAIVWSQSLHKSFIIEFLNHSL